ncbi:MAG: MEKHLA domain-containing protein [Proteobacteria bacterium ST_bin11]|nr:MAG: MEKHLA domain-containing protein [Proteobacteria bacterium ST_bin11]
MLDLPVPSPESDFYAPHIQLLLDSYLRLLGKPLMAGSSALSLGQQVYEADFALLSHNTAADPVFNYANRTAQDLFELSWPEFIGMPSRFSAEPVNREERERLLHQVAGQGYIDNYTGVRIAKSGKRFLIERAVVWNVYDSGQRYVGQAACFSDWRLLP